MKQSLTSLNDYLFSQLERVTNDDLEGEALETEIRRSKAVSGLASQIVSATSIQLSAIRHADEMGYNVGEKAMPLLTGAVEE